MILEFTKMHGLGNDFMVVAPPSLEWPDATTVRRLADRRTGVGFDQLMLVTPPPDDRHQAGYRIFNADGSESGQCGNGARCVARWVAERDGLGERPMLLASPSGSMRARCLRDGQVEIEMGVPAFEPRDIPLRASGRELRYRRRIGEQQLEFGAVSMGNPHAVFQVADVARAPVGILGPALELHSDFPARVNVGFMQLLDRGHIGLRVHERGVGETRACGTGACAAVAVGRQWGLLDEQVTVSLPGGALTVRWAGHAEPVWMTGQAIRVYDGRLTP